MKGILYPLGASIAIILLTFGLFHSVEDQFSSTLNVLSNLPVKYSIVSFLVLASDIIFPVPSSIVLYLNGYILGVIPGTIISIGGLMVGCVIGYYIGKYSSSLFNISKNLKAQHLLSKYGPSAIILTRGIPILSESICIVCGYNALNFRKYILLNCIGYIPVCLIQAYFGNLGFEGKNIFLLSFACSIALSICFWFFGKRLLQESTHVLNSK